MSRRAILQIGTEKTGTTTLQAFLAGNRDRLAARGVRYPHFPGERNHTGLAAYAMDDHRTDAVREAFGVHGPAGVPAFRARIETAAAAELGGEGTVIFCNEHCHSRLKTVAEVRRLADLLTPHFDRIDVCLYLRRQDEVALSLYSTRLKSGHVGSDILPRVSAEDPYFNYDVSLRLWEEVFGRAHIHVRLFDRAELLDGDIVADFLAAWGLGAQRTYRPVGKLNESISPKAQDYLRRINTHLSPLSGRPIDTTLGPLSAALAEHFPGRGARPSREAAVAFYERFRASNAAVCRRYFPGRDTLFPESFDDYPVAADPIEFDAETIATIAARLHGVHLREIRRLEAEIRIREAHLAWQRGDTDAAIAAARRAVAHLPDHPDGHRTLAEYLHRAGRGDEAVAPARKAVDLRPERHDYWHFLGVVLRGVGDLEAAATAQERALEREPAHEPSARLLEILRSEIAASQHAGSDPT